MELSNALNDGEETKALTRTAKTGAHLKLHQTPWNQSFLFSTVHSTVVFLTSVSRVVDGFVRLDEDVARLEGHHYCPFLSVKAPIDHFQVHKLVLLLLTI